MQSVRRIVREIDANVSTTTTWTLIPFFTHSHAEISLTLNEMGGGGLGGGTQMAINSMQALAVTACKISKQ